MRSLARLLALLAIAAALALFSSVCAQPAPTVTIMATDPALSGQLGNYEHLFIRFSYSTAQKIVVRIEGLSAGRPVPGMSDGQFAATPGSGEHMLWIAYQAGVTIDGLRGRLLDQRQQPISSFDTPAHLEWIAGSVRSMRERPEWAVRMYADEQRLRRTPPPTAMELIWGTGLILGVPLVYFIFQAWFGLAWSGRWRRWALAPLILVGPAILWSLNALSHQSNLWPITVL
jgi:hypothetical protein